MTTATLRVYQHGVFLWAKCYSLAEAQTLAAEWNTCPGYSATVEPQP